MWVYKEDLKCKVGISRIQLFLRDNSEILLKKQLTLISAHTELVTLRKGDYYCHVIRCTYRKKRSNWYRTSSPGLFDLFKRGNGFQY